MEAELSLREFCKQAETDPSNWSKVERDRMAVTEDRRKLSKIAGILKLKKGSPERQQFIDLASLSQKKIPEDIYSDEEVIDVLPIFFGALRGDKPKPEELDKLIDLIKRR